MDVSTHPSVGAISHSEVVQLGSIIISNPRDMCDVTFLVRLQGEFEIDHSWEERV